MESDFPHCLWGKKSALGEIWLAIGMLWLRLCYWFNTTFSDCLGSYLLCFSHTSTGEGIPDALRERDTHVSTLGGRHTSPFLAEESRWQQGPHFFLEYSSEPCPLLCSTWQKSLKPINFMALAGKNLRLWHSQEQVHEEIIMFSCGSCILDTRVKVLHGTDITFSGISNRMHSKYCSCFW